MSARIVRTIALSLIFALVTGPLAHAADKGKGKDGGGPIAKILKHASELNLTADQIKQLKDLEKEGHGKGKEANGNKGEKGGHHDLKDKIKAILTADQMEKAKKFLEEHKKQK